MSHGNVDLSGSQIFGWYTLQVNVTDAVRPDPPLSEWTARYSQWEMVNFAKQAAINAGVDMNRFFGTVLIMNVMTGWAQGYSAHFVCADWRRIDGRNPDGTLGPRDIAGGNGTQAFGQEMGHAYGLNHSYREGSNDPYQDRWDIMSTVNTWSVPDQEYCARGPGLNAWNMRSLGWLDESRVWKSPNIDLNFDGHVVLRPLHRRLLPGHLVAEIPAFDNPISNYLMEFRIRSGWDEGIPRSAVLVHQFENNHSVIMRGTSGEYDLGNGESFERLPYTRVRVTSIDESNQTVTLQIALRPPDPQRRECNDLKVNINILTAEIQALEARIQVQTDETQRKLLMAEKTSKQERGEQLQQRYQDLGCDRL
jgi:hypothetical protein